MNFIKPDACSPILGEPVAKPWQDDERWTRCKCMWAGSWSQRSAVLQVKARSCPWCWCGHTSSWPAGGNGGTLERADIRQLGEGLVVQRKGERLEVSAFHQGKYERKQCNMWQSSPKSKCTGSSGWVQQHVRDWTRLWLTVNLICEQGLAYNRDICEFLYYYSYCCYCHYFYFVLTENAALGHVGWNIDSTREVMVPLLSAIVEAHLRHLGVVRGCLD